MSGVVLSTEAVRQLEESLRSLRQQVHYLQKAQGMPQSFREKMVRIGKTTSDRFTYSTGERYKYEVQLGEPSFDETSFDDEDPEFTPYEDEPTRLACSLVKQIIPRGTKVLLFLCHGRWYIVHVIKPKTEEGSHLIEMEVIINTSLKYTDETGEGDFVAFRSSHPDGCCGLEPPTLPVEFKNTYKLDSRCNAHGILRKVYVCSDEECTGTCRFVYNGTYEEGVLTVPGEWEMVESDCSEGCDCPDPPTTTPTAEEDAEVEMDCVPCGVEESFWELVGVTSRKARFASFEYDPESPGPPYSVASFWSGDQPNCPEDFAVSFPLGEPCAAGLVIADLDTRTGEYIARDTESSMMGDPTEVEGIVGVSYYAGCTIQLLKQSFKVFCAGEVEPSTIEPELVSVPVHSGEFYLDGSYFKVDQKNVKVCDYTGTNPAEYRINYATAISSQEFEGCTLNYDYRSVGVFDISGSGGGSTAIGLTPTEVVRDWKVGPNYYAVTKGYDLTCGKHGSDSTYTYYGTTCQDYDDPDPEECDPCTETPGDNQALYRSTIDTGIWELITNNCDEGYLPRPPQTSPGGYCICQVTDCVSPTDCPDPVGEVRTGYTRFVCDGESWQVHDNACRDYQYPAESFPNLPCDDETECFYREAPCLCEDPPPGFMTWKKVSDAHTTTWELQGHQCSTPPTLRDAPTGNYNVGECVTLECPNTTCCTNDLPMTGASHVTWDFTVAGVRIAGNMALGATDVSPGTPPTKLRSATDFRTYGPYQVSINAVLLCNGSWTLSFTVQWAGGGLVTDRVIRGVTAVSPGCVVSPVDINDNGYHIQIL